ncbi:uridine phosphorylase 1 [Capsaspora owczarzaki ATCC 30864]|uniref:Uridine phosphorylase 1 n=1 Tax=Capsaspora owczarzaki (strain ATCC 30864) TaxID=595528 RepID=A0A0D2UK87_CAPO3|nr:uridine phosphorylase 1 [Capsaspora owczarzaki ATCC 30864]KJE95516.1 uridine phosphorylase 1 [Capsaspora owczarzaki ATCC 30864]|eukprot:XP_004345555.1 uridine phosphorylase 1 [Capsaspora owczarzaki ATCC 30864]
MNPLLRKDSVLPNAPLQLASNATAVAAAAAHHAAGLTSSIALDNPHVVKLDVDFLYHLGLDTSMDFKAMFGDVKFVCMGGSNNRMLEFAKRVAEELGITLPVGAAIADVSRTDRYCLYKVGPVISVSHGMGIPSISILLHEITKLMHYAGATEVIYLRIGSSGGIGVPAGTIVITEEALDGELNPFHTLKVLGNKIYRDAKFDRALLDEIAACKTPEMNVLVGKTMCAEDFYEGQARLDGAICEYPQDAKFAFFSKAQAKGVVNMEMESLEFAAFTWHLKIPAAVLCATYLNRMETDQVSSPPHVIHAYSENTQNLALAFMKKRLASYAARPAAK